MNDPNSLVNKAEGAIESLFFTYKTEEKKEIDPALPPRLNKKEIKKK